MFPSLRFPLAALLALGASFAVSPPRQAAAQDPVTQRKIVDCEYFGGEWIRGDCVYDERGPSDPTANLVVPFLCLLNPESCLQAKRTIEARENPETRYSRAANPRTPSFTLSPAERWMAVALVSDRAEARRLGEEYGARFVMTQVFLRSEGDHLVVVGLEAADKAQELVETMIREKRLPAGSFVTRGETIQDRIWATERVLAVEAQR